jgi:hypothetical protein
MIKIYDDFLDEEYYDEIKNLILNSNMSWHYLNNISGDESKGFVGTGRQFGFFHNINYYDNISSPYYKLLYPFLTKVNEVANSDGNIKTRLDLVTNTGEELLHGTHVDFEDMAGRNVTSVFYIGDSDGDTIVYNQRKQYEHEEIPKELSIKSKVTPKANRLVLFSGDYYHTGQSPTNNNRRVIINSNYALNDDNIDNDFYYNFIK